jgi:excisionase family DNA binding protein
MSKSDMPYWPRAMRLATAAAYLELSSAEFLREVRASVLPSGFLLGRSEHWDRHAIDEALDRTPRVLEDWKIRLYAENQPPTPKIASTAKPLGEPYVYSITTLADHWQCSRAHVRKLIAHAELESFHVGKLFKITREAVAAFENADMAREVRP